MAIDVVFREAAVLRRLFPRLVHHGITTFGSPDVLRFLGRRLPLSGQVPTRFSGEVTSKLKQREQGVGTTSYLEIIGPDPEQVASNPIAAEAADPTFLFPSTL